jgi:hypothetical protein
LRPKNGRLIKSNSQTAQADLVKKFASLQNGVNPLGKTITHQRLFPSHAVAPVPAGPYELALE